MITTQETTQAAAAVAGSSTTRSESADPAAFARELGSQMGGSLQERVAYVMERLATSFPNVTVSSQTSTSFAGVSSYYARTGDAASINISSDTLAQMADDETMFDKIKKMLDSVLKAGEEQKLVEAGDSNIHRNVTVTGEEVRYVEVQRGSNGTQLSVSSLAMETEQLVSDTLNQLFAARSGSGSARFEGSVVSSSQSQNTGFQSFVGNSTSWRFQSVVSGAGLANATGNIGSDGIRQLVASSQTTSLEVIIEQWSVSSGSTNASGADLMAYIQMMDLCDPLVFDLGDEGINLRSAEDGVYFDIKGDGSPVQTAFIQGNNAFLYLDQNGNGVVDDVKELFGDFGGYANGFENLAQYDDNGDGIIDELDSIYHELRLWRDLNGDGVNQADESMTLAEAGIKSINLRYDDTKELDVYGNVIGERSTFLRDDGTTGTVADVWLKNKK